MKLKVAINESFFAHFLQSQSQQSKTFSYQMLMTSRKPKILWKARKKTATENCPRLMDVRMSRVIIYFFAIDDACYGSSVYIK